MTAISDDPVRNRPANGTPPNPSPPISNSSFLARNGLKDEQEDDRCECQDPGFFHSGVPGILAHMENGRLAEGAGVERCDLCQRYPSDEAALMRLRELGYGPP
jgi:hypothetical protein